jgi:hypothetical protein
MQKVKLFPHPIMLNNLKEDYVDGTVYEKDLD